MARKLVVRRGAKVGAPPGTLVHIGKHKPDSAAIRLIGYTPDELSESVIEDMDSYARETDAERILWLNVDGVSDAAVVEKLGALFELHPLVMEDILNTDQRPKVEDYQGYLYIVLRMLQFDQGRQQIHSEQLSLVLGPNFVLSFQERPGDVFEGVRERLRAGRRIRFMRTDYLAYALLDAVVDHYFEMLEYIGEQVEALEDQLIDAPGPDTLARIHHYKREMLLLRKSIWPLREVLSRLSRDESTLISEETRLYLRDVYDHAIHVMDSIDTIRELLVSMLDLYLSSISKRMNEIMKVLTIFATLFMPLTFIVGVYGMNFDVMPELRWRWGYPAVMALMLVIVVGLLVFFRRRRWI
ncbi:magnesium and cobalt transport protein CorA [Pseudomonas sp. G11-1]|uniref:Magnesium transport protein CorA n=1 Tax=Halopseudomonas bauzanensis TaxID=653930 RepID=A0A1H9RKK8_9GAMM|nr:MULTISPECIES: magnesium/cobalt transporter CorA [Halopseudomonas]MCO5787590.1 magnesium and cobalt transport protein CorA [Pseudomonas sp. G11-1]MCO5790679.1 magnesium and cobalt transport protein CorA [Pseudomonas sp. G11-2]TKA91462.1 magnesium/cobalt transporter CorA [Halopseudomonas bauzanensis]WGK60159.1 magnesium/cobalt transporter CorA [Halopseudomonas sp. SMJS2]SER73118.1 magnesium transporter [Halopseudomonas bauzanensis]